jgi:hypothetical protein
MSMWPPPFLWLTTTDQSWPGVLKVHRIEVSGFYEAAMPKFLQRLPGPADWLTNFWKFGLSYFLRDNSPAKEETCRG